MLVFASGTWMDSACHQDQAPVCVHVCNGAAIKRRLTEQTCGCSVLRGLGGLKVRTRSPAGPQAPFATDRASLLLLCATVELEVDVRCVLVSARRHSEQALANGGICSES